jgi:hypothetical protein
MNMFLPPPHTHKYFAVLSLIKVIINSNTNTCTYLVQVFLFISSRFIKVKKHLGMNEKFYAVVNCIGMKYI